MSMISLFTYSLCISVNSSLRSTSDGLIAIYMQDKKILQQEIHSISVSRHKGHDKYYAGVFYTLKIEEPKNNTNYSYYGKIII